MTSAIEIIGAALELISLCLLIVLVGVVYKIKTKTKGFGKAWDFIIIAFVLSVFRKSVTFILPKIATDHARLIITSIVIPLITLSIIVLLLAGMYKIKKVFDKIRK